MPLGPVPSPAGISFPPFLFEVAAPLLLTSLLPSGRPAASPSACSPPATTLEGKPAPSCRGRPSSNPHSRCLEAYRCTLQAGITTNRTVALGQFQDAVALPAPRHGPNTSWSCPVKSRHVCHLLAASVVGSTCLLVCQSAQRAPVSSTVVRSPKPRGPGSGVAHQWCSPSPSSICRR